jgi:hypothetical protein
MDETLTSLFEALCYRINELKAKNPTLDMEEVERGAILIQSYLDGFKTYAIEEPIQSVSPALPDMSYEELCKLTRPPRITEKGSVGPAHHMVRYAEEQDNRRARRVDIVIQYGKYMDKNKDKPYF